MQITSKMQMTTQNDDDLKQEDWHYPQKCFRPQVPIKVANKV